MHARFYVPGFTPIPGLVIELPSDQSAHLAQVLRAGPGDTVRVFDGAGREFSARVEEVRRGGARIRLVEPVAPRAEPRVRLTLAQAVLKGDGLDQVVRDVTMAGAFAIHPVLAARVVVDPSAAARGRRVERWRRIAVSSAKQCGRASIPTLADPVSLAAWLERDPADTRLLLAEPTVARAGSFGVASLRDRPTPASASLLVGPEGGWTDAEVDLAAGRGVIPLTLGALTLRADAAALVAMSALFTVWEAW